MRQAVIKKLRIYFWYTMIGLLYNIITLSYFHSIEGTLSLLNHDHHTDLNILVKRSELYEKKITLICYNISLIK